MTMTPEQIAADERCRQSAMSRSVLAVEAAMSSEDKARFLALTAFPGSNLNGAAVADVLDLYADHDECLQWTEPFFDGDAIEAVYAAIDHVDDVRPLPTSEEWYMRAMVASRATLARAVLAQDVPDVESVRDLAVAALAG
jgi:hypothetical protein